MKTLIGIKTEKTTQVADMLNRLLADESILYLKTRNAHWNVEGKDFHSFHKFCEEQYLQLADMIDDIAERIRTIGHFAEATIASYLNLTSLSEKRVQSNNSEGFIKELLEDHETLIINTRQNIDKLSDELNDYGSSDFLTDILRIHEKMAWMLRAHLV